MDSAPRLSCGTKESLMKYSILLIASLTVPLVACDEKPAAEETQKTDAEGKTEEAKQDGEKNDAHAAFTNLSPDEVQKLVDSEGCVPVDANGANTREKYGVLPGAVLLSGSDYQTSELPDDKGKKLVFYCGSKACTAAPKAAKVAKEAGYKDVNVMRDGIRGWVKAGKTVDKPKS
jgi:rhodanese-related sulfurtransferase